MLLVNLINISLYEQHLNNCNNLVKYSVAGEQLTLVWIERCSSLQCQLNGRPDFKICSWGLQSSEIKVSQPPPTVLISTTMLQRWCQHLKLPVPWPYDYWYELRSREVYIEEHTPITSQEIQSEPPLPPSPKCRITGSNRVQETQPISAGPIGSTLHAPYNLC